MDYFITSLRSEISLLFFTFFILQKIDYPIGVRFVIGFKRELLVC